MYFDSSYFSSHTSVPLPSFLSLSLSLLSIMRFVTEKSLFSLSQTIQNLREKVNAAAESASRQSELIEATVAKTRSLDAERSELEGRVRKMEAQLTDCELAKERSRRDKQTFVTFLDRLGKAMQMDEITEEMGIDLQTESLLVRGEQLARLESDKLVDKTSVVYQLQRRVRTLREQLQRRDLHLDLLRRKLSLQEESVKMRSLLQNERDEACLRAKKIVEANGSVAGANFGGEIEESGVKRAIDRGR